MSTRWLLALPPVIFAGIAATFFFGMGREGQGTLPSTFTGREAPVLPALALPGTPLLTAEDLRAGEVTVVNFWASWCPPCRAEHPVLKRLAEEGIRIGGINIMEGEADALKYLAEEGNPFFALAADPMGRNRVEWGVTAPPETFIIDGSGKVLMRFQGPLLGTDAENRFFPALRAALEGKGEG